MEIGFKSPLEEVRDANKFGRSDEYSVVMIDLRRTKLRNRQNDANQANSGSAYANRANPDRSSVSIAFNGDFQFTFRRWRYL